MEDVRLKTIRQRAAVRVACGKPASRTAALPGETAWQCRDWEGWLGRPSTGCEMLAPRGLVLGAVIYPGWPSQELEGGKLEDGHPTMEKGGWGKKHSSYIRGVPNQDCFVCFYYIYIFNMYKSNIFKIYKSNIRPLWRIHILSKAIKEEITFSCRSLRENQT